MVGRHSANGESNSPSKEIPMNRNGPVVLLAVSLVLSLVGQAAAQIVLPPLPQGRPSLLTKVQLEQLQRALDQGLVPGRRPDANGGVIQWGGLRLTKVDATLQE